VGGRGLQKYRFERGEAFLPLTLRSHTLFEISLFMLRLARKKSAHYCTLSGRKSGSKTHCLYALELETADSDWC